MIKKIALNSDGQFDALYPSNRPTRVTLLSSDGNIESVEVLIPKGDGERALSRADVDLKARRLLDSAWGEGRSVNLFALIDGIEDKVVDDFLVELGKLLRHPLAT